MCNEGFLVFGHACMLANIQLLGLLSPHSLSLSECVHANVRTAAIAH